MTTDRTTSPPAPADSAAAPHARPAWPPIAARWARRTIGALLVGSLLANAYMYGLYRDYFASAREPSERYHSGDKHATDKIALIDIVGTISPPFTSQILRAIKHAKEDDAVKGVVLNIDSPGGLVTDSHQIYHRLVELRQKKPIVVSMGSLAASGGYYVAMGAGPKARIYAEPTTWTGSIGVIIPRYQAKELAGKLGVEFQPLKTGPFKDALSPFRDLTAAEREIWDDIIDQSYQRFLKVIDDNRDNLNAEQVRALATGRIFTADDAKQNGLIDEIGYKEDAVAALQQQAGLTAARVVQYDFPDAWLDVLSSFAKSPEPNAHWRALLEASVPRAMYYCSWGLGLPGEP